MTIDYTNLLKYLYELKSLFNRNNYVELDTQNILFGNTCYGVIHTFKYNNGLRVNIIFYSTPEADNVVKLRDTVIEIIRSHGEIKARITYLQIKGEIPSEVSKAFPVSGSIHSYMSMYMKRSNISSEQSKGALTRHRYTKSRLNDCMNILESAFTPEWDTPGTYTDNSESYHNTFSNPKNGRCEVFYLGTEAIGLYLHNDGMIHYIGVKKQFHGNGYGKEILNRAFQAILVDTDKDPRLTPNMENKGAIAFYKKMGMYCGYKGVGFFVSF